MADDKYGLSFDHPVNDLEVELYCFRNGRTPEEGGLGRFQHFRNAVDILWPETKWNPWLERQLESLCENQWTSWAGCAASGKTFGSSIYAMVWWLAKPQESSVILTSTTAKMIRKRAWANIQQLYRACPGFPGNLVDSKTTLQSVKGDDRQAIFAIPVLDGATSKAVANIQGVHSPRILVIVDEATDTPEAAFEACSNLSKGCEEFQFLAIGNPHSHLDEHGRFSEPIGGWDSVGVETQEWKTKYGVCLRFDGMHSPNVEAGETKYPFLITSPQVQQAISFEGESSPKFWKYTRGFWPLEGVVRTVLSETMCEKYKARQQLTFINNAITIGGLDPAFGGDRCILRFARYGDLDGGKMGIQLSDVIPIKVDANSVEPIHFQIANKVREACIMHGCEPRPLAIDSTGEGGGLCDILSKEWSNQIRRVEFGGRASDLPVSEQDGRPSHEAYNNRVTELWLSVREWIMAEQIGGMDDPTIIEFCSRLFDDTKRKLVVERKSEMKARTNQSPDLADAAVLIVELARQLGSGRLHSVTERDKKWNEMVNEYDSLYAEDNLYAGME